jgi:hypothetical protein
VRRFSAIVVTVQQVSQPVVASDFTPAISPQLLLNSSGETFVPSKRITPAPHQKKFRFLTCIAIAD